MEPNNIQPPVQETPAPVKSSGAKWIIGIIILIIAVGVYLYTTQQSNTSMDTQTDSTDQSIQTDISTPVITTDSPEDTANYTSDYSPKAQTAVAGDVQFTLPSGFKQYRSVFKRAVSGVSKDAIVMYEVRDSENSVVMVINQYLDREFFTTATDQTKLGKTYDLVKDGHPIDNQPALLYKAKDVSFQDMLVIVPSKMLKVSINPYYGDATIESQANDILTSIKF